MSVVPCDMMSFKHLRICIAGLDHQEIYSLEKAIRQILKLAKGTDGIVESGNQVTQWGGFYTPEGNVSHPCGCVNCRGVGHD